MKKYTLAVLFVFVVIVGFVSSVVSADEIVFKNGDSLTGDVKQLVEGKLVLDSWVVGVVTIDVADVAIIRTGKNVKIEYTNGDIIHKPIRGLLDENISSINKPKEKVWSGDVSVGITSTNGNTVTDNQNVTASLKREKENTVLNIDFDYAYASNEKNGKKTVIKDNWRANAKYDYFFTEKKYGFAKLHYGTDSIALLDSRVILGGGFGYQWIKSSDFNFSTDFGLVHRTEEYMNNTPKSSAVSAQLGYSLDKKLSDRLKFIHNLEVYPSIEDSADYFLTANTELRLGITENTFANFRVLYDYDSTPANNRCEEDLKYIVGVGAKF